MKEYDIAIIGAGPAGAMLARLLDKTNLKVALFDMRPLDRVYRFGDLKKSCGGLLAPDTQKFLKKQNIKVPDKVLAKVQSDWVKTADLCSGIVRTYKRNYINIDREAFDRFLLEGLNADKYFGKRIHKIEEMDGFVIDDHIKAKVLVGADGAGSLVRRRFFAGEKFREYASIQEGFADNPANDFECYFDERLTDYYGWRYSKDEGYVLGLALPGGANARERFEKFKAEIGAGESIYKEGTIIIRPKMLHPVLARENVFLIGEAGGYISPSSAEGISFAFKTAKILADSGLSLQKFKRKMLVIQASIFIKSIKSWFMYNPIMRRVIMLLTLRKNPKANKFQG